MNPNQFIKLIKSVVVNNSQKALLEILENPPGRNPNKDLINTSNWFHNLSIEDKNHINWIISQASEQAAFNFLCLLDGVVGIDNESENEYFELNYVDNQSRKILLNDSDDEYLHDIFNQLD